MDQPPALTLTLELDSTTEPLTGRLVRAGRDPVAFRGWVGLSVALARLTAPADGALIVPGPPEPV